MCITKKIIDPPKPVCVEEYFLKQSEYQHKIPRCQLAFDHKPDSKQHCPDACDNGKDVPCKNPVELILEADDNFVNILAQQLRVCFMLASFLRIILDCLDIV